MHWEKLKPCILSKYFWTPNFFWVTIGMKWTKIFAVKYTRCISTNKYAQNVSLYIQWISTNLPYEFFRCWNVLAKLKSYILHLARLNYTLNLFYHGRLFRLLGSGPIALLTMGYCRLFIVIKIWLIFHELVIRNKYKFNETRSFRS